MKHDRIDPAAAMPELDPFAPPHGAPPMRVAAWLTQPAPCVREEVTAAAACDVMRARMIEEVPVTDAAGCFVGVLREEDVRRSVLAAAAHDCHAAAAMTAAPLVTRDAPCVAPDSDVRDAARLMRERGVQVLPVVADTRLVGILTMNDVKAAAAALQRAERRSER